MVNREEARMLVASVGYEEAASRTGIKPATLRQWSKRYNWKIIPTHALAVTNVTKPSDALATVLSERKDQTKLNLSKYAVEASESAANHKDKLQISAKVKDIASVAGSVWPEERGEVGINLNVLSIGGEMAVQINSGSR